MDLADFVDITQSECLNTVDPSVLQLVLLGKEGDPTLGAPENPVELTSDSDEQLLIKIGFRERVKLLAVAVLGPAKFAPKAVSLFTNNQVTLSCQLVASPPPSINRLFLESDFFRCR